VRNQRKTPTRRGCFSLVLSLERSYKPLVPHPSAQTNPDARQACYSKVMQSAPSPIKQRITTALVSGVLIFLFYRFYLRTHNREQFEDSNLFVSIVTVLVVSIILFLVLKVVSRRQPPK
jgi:hypothetical protein